MKAVDVRISGLVQGVFFRASCAEAADRLGVSGWVSNEADGTVAGHFEGPATAVDELLAWCRRGPRHARVDDVRVDEAQATGSTGFATR